MLPKKSPLIFALLIAASSVKAQDADSLLRELHPDSVSSLPSPTFKSTRIVLTQSVETQKKYDLDLRIRHHFGDIGGEFGDSHTLYGLDVATDLHIGLDYGITDRLTVGIGRSKQNELYNLFLKQRVLQQAAGSAPVSLSLLAQAGWITRKQQTEGEFDRAADRFSYFIQGLLAKRLSEQLSLQLSPGYLIRSKTEDPADEKGLFSAGIAGRYKFSKRMSLLADYQTANLGRTDNLSGSYYNSLAVGLEIETGGHIFSLNFMNTEAIVENNFLPDTRKSWTDGGVRFGFTISRNFTLHRSKNQDIKSKIY